MSRETELASFKEFVTEQRQMLNEMIVDGEVHEHDYIVAFEKYIFVFDEQHKGEYLNKILDILIDLFPTSEFITDTYFIKRGTYSGRPVPYILRRLNEYVRDLFYGEILVRDYTYYIQAMSKQDEYSSLLLQKVRKKMGIRYINEYEISLTSTGMPSYDGYTYFSDTDQADISDIGYHGTSTKYITSILRLGIRASMANSNWEFVNHDHVIFFSTKSIIPLFHAKRISGNESDHTLPIIIEFDIPHKEYVVQDFDMENRTGASALYDNPMNIKKSAITDKPMRLSKEMGIYGYKANIPPKFIKAVWIPKIPKQQYMESDFIRLTPKEAIKHLKIFTL